MKIDAAHDRLKAGWQVLQTRWQASRAQWDDPVARRFEKEFWQEYEQVLPATLQEMQNLAEVIAQARRNVR
ncbi:MAG: hypothetical protein JXA21_23040 [Anaerolineae bacterium]|nr:hypothetical protein [Anaerolineae bacterium]